MKRLSRGIWGAFIIRCKEKGWKPYRCFNDLADGSVLRIDKNGEKYRLLMYHNRNRLSDIPDLCVYGTLDIQGSKANELYTFVVGETTCEFFMI